MDHTEDDTLASLDTTGVSYRLLSVAHAGIDALRLTNVGARGANISDVNLSGSTFSDCRLEEVTVVGCNVEGMTINDISVTHALAATFGDVDKNILARNVAMQVMRSLNINKADYAHYQKIGDAVEAICGDWHDAVMGQMDNFTAGKLGELASCWLSRDKWGPLTHLMMGHEEVVGPASYDFRGNDTMVELATMVTLDAILKLMLADHPQYPA